MACFRIGFGLIVFWEVVRYVYYDWVGQLFVRPTFLFSFPLAPVPRWPSGGIYVHFLVLGIAALAVSLGLFYRLSAWIVCLGLTYVFLLDASYSLDLNHMYLMCLFAFILAVAPAHRIWSLDRRLSRRADIETVPYWPIFLLRAQIVIVYFFSGLAKLTPAWLLGNPAQRILAGQAASKYVEPFFHLPIANSLIIYGGIAVDLLLPVLLILRSTRILGVMLASAFLLFNSLAFAIGVFPVMALLATAMLLPPSIVREGAQAAGSSTTHAVAKLWTVFASFYVLMQVLLPLRSALYPGPSTWSEEGHFFSWRMMTLEKKGSVEFEVIDRAKNRSSTWDANRELTPLQMESLSTRPLLVAQYARHIADLIETNEGVRPEVHARQWVSFGGSAAAPIIDPAYDLAAQAAQMRHAPWILPCVAANCFD